MKRRADEVSGRPCENGRNWKLLEEAVPSGISGHEQRDLGLEVGERDVDTSKL